MKRLILGAAAVLCLGVAPALADGIPTRGKTTAYEHERACSVSGSVGVATENVFRGVSKSLEDTSIQGGLELSCGRFYVGVSGAGAGAIFGTDLDFTAGYRASFGKVNVDASVTYYTFQGGIIDLILGDDADFAEFKLAANTQVWHGGSIAASVAFAPEYFGFGGEVFTYEVGFSQVLPKVGIFTPTFSAAYGYSDFQDFSDASYGFWNVGLTLGFLEKWSLDVRYHDTDGDGISGPLGFFGLADERFVTTLKYSF
jgi:uncharacterized protein (TIGR02001 family)